ncbi:MAG: hypothetical protein EPN88_05105 [Bacteroidetes bacterium]|nr:MAG: hypothetical protein EPN88_05105 [Bacteroidota bacterium]
MKQITRILILIIIYFVCGARSCTDESNMKELREEKLLAASIDSVKKAFEVYSPADQLLRTYEGTAKLKLNDFADYLKIASDSSIDIIFRQQAAEMAGNLFISGKAVTQNWGNYSESNTKTLDKLLEKSLAGGMPFWTKPGKINIYKPLFRENDSIYIGSLSFCQNCIPFDTSRSLEISLKALLIDIYAIKKLKSFGKENLSIWEVYLGDIE